MNKLVLALGVLLAAPVVAQPLIIPLEPQRPAEPPPPPPSPVPVAPPQVEPAPPPPAPAPEQAPPAR